MAHYTLPTPVSEADVRKLRINDTVTLQNRHGDIAKHAVWDSGCDTDSLI